jgi:hypothetical protein
MRPGRSRPPNGARQAEAAAIGNAEGSVGASDVVPDLGDGTGMPVVATPVTGRDAVGVGLVVVLSEGPRAKP